MDAKNEGDFHESIDPGVNRLCHGFRITVLYVNLMSNDLCRTALLRKKIYEFFCVFALKCLKSLQTPMFPSFLFYVCVFRRCGL